MRKRIIIIGIIVLIIAFFVGKNMFISYEKSKHGKIPPPTVEVAKAQQQSWQDQITATGTISAINGVVLKPEVAGRITKIYFKSGSYVKEGQPLFQIYPDILQAQLESNEASLSLAQVEYDRADELFQKKVASKQTLDEQTAKLKSAEAAVAQTKAELVQHNITAPFSGKIGLKQVDIGDYVNIGQTLVPLQQMNPLRVQFSVPDRYLSEVKIGDKVDIQVSSAANTVYQGYVYALNSAVDPTTRMFSMWAKIPNPDHSLIPGTYVQITLYSGQSKPVITVPQTAVVYSPQGQYVFTMVKGIAKKTQVNASERKGNLIAIDSGLKADDIVVTAGQVKLFDNMPANISNQPTYAPALPANVKLITFKDSLAPNNTNKSSTNAVSDENNGNTKQKATESNVTAQEPTSVNMNAGDNKLQTPNKSASEPAEASSQPSTDDATTKKENKQQQPTENN